jgi:hypothetical protein
MAKVKVLYGEKTGTYKGVAFEQLVGKTIQAIGVTTVEGENGSEPAVVLFFKDGTKHTFVLAD